MKVRLRDALCPLSSAGKFVKIEIHLQKSANTGCFFNCYTQSAKKKNAVQPTRIFVYDSFSDVGESRVWFASKNLTPCRMH